jgi:hypothetical protein
MSDNGLFGNFFESSDGYSTLTDGQKPENTKPQYVGTGEYPNTVKWDFSALGSAMNQIALAVKGKDKATLLDFSPSSGIVGALPNPFDQNDYLYLYGWLFESTSDGSQDALIVNYKSTSFNLDLSQILPGSNTYTYEEIKPNNILFGVDANPIDFPNPSIGKNLVRHQGTYISANNNFIKLRPYSILRVHGIANPVQLTAQLAASEICEGTATTLIIHGGTPPYSVNGQAISYDFMPITGLTAGNYGFNVTDNNSQNASATLVVDKPITSLAVSISGPANCTGPTNLTATFTASPNSLPQNISCIWTPTEGIIQHVNSCATDDSSMNACITVQPTKTTDYQVYVTDGVCWAHSDPVTINAGPISIDAGRDFTICTGTNFNLRPITDLVSGVAMTYTWTWAGGFNTSTSSPNLDAQSISNPGTVTYTLTASDGTCSVSDDITVHAVNCCGSTSFQNNLHYVDGYDLINGLSTSDFTVVYSKSNPNSSYDDIVTVTSLLSSAVINSDADLWVQPYNDSPVSPTKKIRSYIFQKCNFNMSQDAILRIRSNVTATFQGCNFNVCNSGAFSHPMWQGFIVDRDSDKTEPELEITNSGATWSSIKNAKTAIYLHRDSPYRIQKCDFKDNYKDIIIEDYKYAVDQNYNVTYGATNFYIRSCTFEASDPPALLPPYSSDAKSTAIELNNVVDVIIGDYLKGTNEFKFSKCGIDSYQSGFEGYNLYFHDIDMLGGTMNDGSCINSNVPYLEDDLTVQVGAAASTQGNIFDNSSNGIYLIGPSNNRIYNNRFGVSNQSNGLKRIKYFGVYTDGSDDKLIDISRGNLFYDFNFGVTCRNVGDDATLRIDSNLYANGWFDTGTNYNATAINVLNHLKSTLLNGTISSNTIGGTSNCTNCQARIGINVSGPGNININYNTINFSVSSSPSFDFRGIRMENSDGSAITNNNIYNTASPTSSFTTNFIGCYIKDCTVPFVQCNDIINMGYAMQFEGQNSYVPLRRNTYDNYTVAVNLNNADIGPQQGTSGVGYDNGWVNGGNNDRVAGSTLSGVPIDWYFRDVPTYANIVSPVPSAATITGLIRPKPNQANGTSDDLCGLIYARLGIDTSYSILLSESDSSFNLLTDLQKYDLYSSFYNYVQSDTSLLSTGTSSESQFRTIFNNLSNSNNPPFESSVKLLSRRKTSDALGILSATVCRQSKVH